MLYNNDKYYLLGIAAGDNEVRTYRVDQMDGVASMKAPRHAKEVFKQVDLADYTQYTFSMYAGKPEKVTLLFDNGYLTVARDRFGYDVPVKKYDDSRFEMEVLVAVSPQFYGWIFGLGDKVEIAEPPYVREGMKETLELISHRYK